MPVFPVRASPGIGKTNRQRRRNKTGQNKSWIMMQCKIGRFGSVVIAISWPWAVHTVRQMRPINCTTTTVSAWKEQNRRKAKGHPRPGLDEQEHHTNDDEEGQ